MSRPLKWSSKHETNRAPHAAESLDNLSLAVTSRGFPKRPPHISHTLGGSDIPIGTKCPEVEHVLPEVEFSQYGMMAVSDQYEPMATSVFPSHIPWDQLLAADTQDEQNDHHDDYQLEDFHDDIIIPKALYDRDVTLSNHYFSTICRINCAVDSSSNPLRLWIADSIHCSPLVYHCVLSMSAAHLAERDTSVKRDASQQRREAISRLESEILEPGQTICSTNSRHFDSKVLLSCILLGMTDVSFLNLLN